MLKFSDAERSFRYEVRIETEQSIKNLNIDRANFREAPKNEWKSVIRRFYYMFIDYKTSPNIHLSYLWLRFRPELTYTGHIQNGCDTADRTGFVGNIDSLSRKKTALPNTTT